MDKTAQKFRNNLVNCYMAVYATEKERREGKIFGFLFVLPYFLLAGYCVLRFMSIGNRPEVPPAYELILPLVVLLCFGIAYPYMMKRRKKIENEFLQDREAYQKVELSPVENFMEFPNLEEEFAFMLPTEKVSNELLSDIYTWFYNLNLLKEDTLNIYTFTGKQMREKYDYKVRENATILFVPMKDLCMDESNREKYIEQSVFLHEGKKPGAMVEILKKCKRA